MMSCRLLLLLHSAPAVLGSWRHREICILNAGNWHRLNSFFSFLCVCRFTVVLGLIKGFLKPSVCRFTMLNLHVTKAAIYYLSALWQVPQATLIKGIGLHTPAEKGTGRLTFLIPNQDMVWINFFVFFLVKCSALRLVLGRELSQEVPFGWDVKIQVQGMSSLWRPCRLHSLRCSTPSPSLKLKCLGHHHLHETSPKKDGSLQ